MIWVLLFGLIVSILTIFYLQWRIQALEVEAAYERGLARDERKEHMGAIKEMADRIQHPDVRVVAPGEVHEYDPPKDHGEMNFVGEIVPDGYQVGTTEEQAS